MFHPPVAAETLERLRGVSSATLATQLFKLGLRNTFMPGLRALCPELKMVGEAVTLRFLPAREDLATFEHIGKAEYPQRKAVESIQSGQVLVVDCRGNDAAAAGGDVYLTRIKVLGAAGYVVDGCLRDFAGVQSLGLPIYARGPASPPHPARHLAIDMNQPIACADVLVFPGDIIVGDADGVVCIPRHLAEQVSISGAELEELEAFVIRKIRAGAAVQGTYPPNDAMRAEYEQWRANGKPERL